MCWVIDLAYHDLFWSRVGIELLHDYWTDLDEFVGCVYDGLYSVSLTEMRRVMVGESGATVDGPRWKLQ